MSLEKLLTMFDKATKPSNIVNLKLENNVTLNDANIQTL